MVVCMGIPLLLMLIKLEEHGSMATVSPLQCCEAVGHATILHKPQMCPPCWHSFVPMDRGGVSTGSTFSWPIPIKAVSMPVPLMACKMFCSTVSRMPNVFRMYLSCPIESGSLLEMTITHFIFRCLGAHAQARYTFVCLCVLFVDL